MARQVSHPNVCRVYDIDEIEALTDRVSVLRDGVLLLSRDDRARVRYVVRTVDGYCDMAPMRRMYAEGTRHRLAEGRFGRP